MEENEKAILIKALSHLDFAHFLKLEELQNSIDCFDEIHAKKNSKILGRGKVGKSFVIIGSGKVSVWQSEDDVNEVKTGELGPGEYFGEISLLLGKPRIATFIAEEETLLFFLKKKDFQKLFARVPEIKDLLETKAYERIDKGYHPSRGEATDAAYEKQIDPPAQEQAGSGAPGQAESRPIDTGRATERDSDIISYSTRFLDSTEEVAGPGPLSSEEPSAPTHITPEGAPDELPPPPDRLDEILSEPSLISPEIEEKRKAPERAKEKKESQSMPTGFLDASMLESQKEEELERHSVEEAFLLLRQGTPLPREELELYQQIFKPVYARKGIRLLSAGQKDENFCIIASGKVEFRENDEVKQTLGPGSHFGELSLLYDRPRATDCFTSENTWLYRLNKENFFKFFVIDPESERLIKTTSQDAMPEIDLGELHYQGQEWIEQASVPVRENEEKNLRKVLSELRFFKYLSESDFDRCKTFFRKLEIKRDSSILKEGMMGYYFFIVAEGKIKAKITDELGTEISVEESGRGDFFGEESLISHSPVVFDIVAETDLKAYVINRKHFFRDLVTNPDIEALITLSAQDKIEKAKKFVKPKDAKKTEVLPLSETDNQLLEETIRKLEFSEYFTDRNYESFKTAFKKIAVGKNSKILGKGKKGNAFLIVASGKVSVRAANELGEEREQATLSQSSYFGEESLLLDKPRTVDFWAEEDTVLLHLTRKNFHKYFVIHPAIEKRLREVGDYRLTKGYSIEEIEKSELWVHENSRPIPLRYVPLFDETLKKFEYSRYLQRDEMIALRNFFKIYPVKKGAVVIKYGSRGEFFFLVARGKIALKKFTTEGEDLTVREYQGGEYFGELSLLKDTTREANYVATQDSLLFCIAKSDFIQYFLSNQMVRQFVMKKAEERAAPPEQRKKAPGIEIVRKEKLILPENLEGAMAALRSTGFFNFMNRARLETVLRQFIAVQFAPGVKIPIDEEKGLYVISEGRIVVMGRDRKGGERKIESLSPGEWFGENESLEEAPRLREYYSDGISVVYHLALEDFRAFIDEDFGAKYFIEKSVRLKNQAYERSIPAPKKGARLRIHAGFITNLMVILTWLKVSFVTLFLNPAARVYNALKYLFKNLPHFKLMFRIIIAETGLFMIGSYYIGRKRLKRSVEGVRRNIIFIVTANVNRVKTTVRDFINKTSPLEKRRCNPMSLAIFTRQMGMLMEVGVGLKRTFTILLNQTDDKNLKVALVAMEKEVILKGIPFSLSMKRFPGIFNDFYVSLIRSGEVSGRMGHAFQTCALFQEKEITLRKRLGAAMVYPAVVLACCVALLFGVTIYVMPTFVRLFEDLEITLPLTTRIIIAFVKGVRNPFIVTASILFLIFLLNSLKAYYSTVPGKKLIDTITVNMILFGDLLRKVFITRFCWTLSGLINGGITITESLKTAEAIVTNSYMKEQIERCRLRIVEGKSFTTAVEKVDILPRMFKDMVMVGEETGHLPEQLRKIGDYYDAEINYSVDTFSSMLEPLLIMVMGVIIGFVLVSLFLPIYQIVKTF